MGRGWAGPVDEAERRAYAAARAVCRRHARTFYFASMLLPRPKRLAAYAVYAFCRLLDDAVDAPMADGRPADAAVLEARLAGFRELLDRVYGGEVEPTSADADEERAALAAFARTARRCAIPKEHFLDLAEGCRMDLTVGRYATWADLERYCYHVAGVVGLIMCRVFGLRDEPSARRQAVLMGNAMQLTNILRDVREDLVARGRIYLPLEDLDRFGVRQEDLAAGVVDRRFEALMRFEIERARGLFRAGAAGLVHLAPDGSRQTASAMAVIYAGILSSIERRGYDVFAGRAHLTTLEKVARLPAAYRLARRGRGQPVPEVF